MHALPLEFLHLSNFAHGVPNLFFTVIETDVIKRMYLYNAMYRRGHAHYEQDPGARLRNYIKKFSDLKPIKLN